MNLFDGKSYYYVKLKENIKTLLTYIPSSGTNQEIYVYLSNITDSNGTHVSAIQQTENIYFVKDKEEDGYTYFDIHLQVPVLRSFYSGYTYKYKISRIRLLKDLPSTYTETLSQMDEYLGFDFVDENGTKVSWTREGRYSNSLTIFCSNDDSGKPLDIFYGVNFPAGTVSYDYLIFDSSIRIKVSGINVAPKNIKVKNWWTDVEPSYFGTLINTGTFTEQITRVKYSSIREHSLPEIYYWEIPQDDGSVTAFKTHVEHQLDLFKGVPMVGKQYCENPDELYYKANFRFILNDNGWIDSNHKQTIKYTLPGLAEHTKTIKLSEDLYPKTAKISKDSITERIELVPKNTDTEGYTHYTVSYIRPYFNLTQVSAGPDAPSKDITNLVQGMDYLPKLFTDSDTGKARIYDIYVDFYFKDSKGKEIEWELVNESENKIINEVPKDENGNDSEFFFALSGNNSYVKAVLIVCKSSIEIKVKADRISEAFMRRNSNAASIKDDSSRPIIIRVFNYQANIDLGHSSSTEQIFEYCIASESLDPDMHKRFFMTKLKGQPNIVKSNRSNSYITNIPELVCYTSDICQFKLTHSDGYSNIITIDSENKNKGNSNANIAIYANRIGFADFKVSSLFGDSLPIYKDSLYEVKSINNTPNYFDVNINKDGERELPYQLKNSGYINYNLDTKLFDTTTPVFTLKSVNSPDYSYFDYSKLKVYQKIYTIDTRISPQEQTQEINITDHLTIVQEQGDYVFYVKDRFQVSSGLYWPDCTSTVDYPNTIRFDFDGQIDYDNSFNINMLQHIYFDPAKAASSDHISSYSIFNNNESKYFELYHFTNSLDDKTRIYERSKETSFEEGEALIHSPEGARFKLFGIYYGFIFKNMFNLIPLYNRSFKDQTETFTCIAHNYKFLEAHLHLAKSNIFVYGVDVDRKHDTSSIRHKYDRFIINGISDNTKANYLLFYTDNKDFSKIDFKLDNAQEWGYDYIDWRVGAPDDIVTIDGVPYNKIYIWAKDSYKGTGTLGYATAFDNCYIFDKDNGGRGYFQAVLWPKERIDLLHSFIAKGLANHQVWTDVLKFPEGVQNKIYDFTIDTNSKTVSFKVNNIPVDKYGSYSFDTIFNYGYYVYKDSELTERVQEFKQFDIIDIKQKFDEYDDYANRPSPIETLFVHSYTEFICKLPSSPIFGNSYIIPAFTSKTGYLVEDLKEYTGITTDDIKFMNEDNFTPANVNKQRTGDDFHFIDKSITVDSVASVKDIRFYWNGLLTDLTVFSASGFPSVSYITLPTELTDNGIYTLKVRFDENTGSSMKNYSVTIAKRSDTTIRDRFNAVQNNIILAELSWVKTEYSGIKYNQTTQDIQFKYKGTKTPYEDLQLTTDAGFVILPELPKTKSSDGIYTINVNIGSNLTTDKKIAFIGIAYKDYSAISYTETKLIQDVKKDPILTITPNIYNVNNEVNIISVKLKFDDYENTTPKDGLYVSNNLGLVDYELPAELTDNKEYNLSITVPANNTENDRDFYFTVKTNDAKYSATVNIHQGAAQLTRLYFTPDNISVDATQNTVNVQLFYNGKASPYNDLIITTSWDENIQLPKTVNPDGFYNITLNIGTNTSYEALDFIVDVQTKDGRLNNSLQIYQRGSILPDTVFYWEKSSYSIEFNKNYVEAVLHYNDYFDGIPFDRLSIAPESTYREFSLPTAYKSDGIYIIRFNIGPNNDYEIKRYTVVLEEKTTGNKQSVSLSIGAKQSSQLFWLPDSLTINHDQESIQVNYYWNNYQGGTPSNYLMMSSNIPGFVPYLPDTISPNNNYTFVINLGENTGLASRNYTVTIRSADRLYSSVLHIMQYGTGGDADFTYYFEKQNIIAPASGEVPHGYISNKLIGSLTNLTGEYDIISIPYWIKKENIRFDKTGGLLIIDKETPNVFAERTGKVQVLFYSNDGKTYAAEFTVTQEAGEIDSTNISPIWRDSWVNIDADYNYFRLVNKKTNQIYFNGQTIQGELAQFKLNNVISDYLNVWSSFGSSLQNGNNFTTSPVEISVSCSKNGSDFDYTLPDSYKFIWDYSYDKHVPGILFNGNIINYYDPRQKMMISSSNRSNYEMITKVETIFANDSKSTIEEYSLLPGEMHATFVPAYSGSGDGAVKIKVSCTVQGQTEVKEYVPKCTKANYVLHYVNRYGQVCWMLFAGKQIKSDKITSSKFVQAYDNNYRYNFENVVYQNKVEESWQLTTSYLTDKQSENLTDLYSSPIVFLEDLNAANTDNIIAVTVETKSVDYKNYKNQGKFFTHTIKVQNAQNKFILL